MSTEIPKTPFLQDAEITPKNAPRPRAGYNRKPRKIDVKKALEMKVENGLTYREIAKIQGVTCAAVYKAIKKLLPAAETKMYKEHRADIMAGIQAKMIEQVTNDKKLKALSPLGAMEILDKSYKIERLERGLSTDNTAIHALVHHLKFGAEKEIAADA